MEKAITRNPKTRVRSGREVSSILSAEEKKRLVKQKAKELKHSNIPKTAQQTITFKEMYRDGICKVTDHFYTKCIQFGDTNYQLAQNEDKTAIFEYWCDFYNYFDSRSPNTSPHLENGWLVVSMVDLFSYLAAIS